MLPLGGGLGLRQGEILGLSPDDIDREQMIVHIDRQPAYVGNRPLFKLPKGRKTRTVPISRGLLNVIDDHIESHPPVVITLPWGKTTADPISVRLLIATASGRVDTGTEFNHRHWQPAFTTADLIYIDGEDGMHALRHFYASTLLTQGVTIKESADYLGHTDPGFTLRTHTPTALPPRTSTVSRGQSLQAASAQSTWSQVLGRLDDGLDEHKNAVLARQRDGAEEARLLIAW
ncbi:MAG: tyrosine-type recombinase/integrase [Pseudonocardiaceae bacterium]